MKYIWTFPKGTILGAGVGRSAKSFPDQIFLIGRISFVSLLSLLNKAKSRCFSRSPIGEMWQVGSLSYICTTLEMSWANGLLALSGVCNAKNVNVRLFLIQF